MRGGRFIETALLLATILGCAGRPLPAAGREEIIVSTAVSLKNAFGEIGSLFEKQTGVRVRFNLGSSGLLQKQIEAGAPADIFASASVRQMDALESRGLILPDTRRDFARNELVLIEPVGSRGRLSAFTDIERPGVARIALGNPKTVPAGQYARETLGHLGLWGRLEPRFILAENVRQVLDYVARGEVDAGIVYSSDVAVASGKVRTVAKAPPGTHSAIVYPMAAVKGTGAPNEARRFIDLATSPAGQAVLRKHGFLEIR
jgi:molybdate transport system substrate-binding protein